MTAAAIRQHVNNTGDADNDAVFASVLAGSLILIRLVNGKSLTDPTMATAGFTKLGGCHATGTAGAPADSGAAAMFAKIAAGGETTISRLVGNGLMCGYEITNPPAIAAIELLSASDLGTASLSDIGSFAAAWGLMFNLHLCTLQEAGVHSASGVNSGGYTEVHDQACTITSGQPDDSFLWMGNAAGAGAAVASRVTFTGSPPIVNTAGIAVLLREAAPGIGGTGFIGELGGSIW